MKTKNSTDPSHAVVLQILFKSDYLHSIEEKCEALRTQIADEKDVATRVQLNGQLQFHRVHISKLFIIVTNIYDTFRTIPFESKRLKQAKKCFYASKFTEMDELLDPDETRADSRREKDPLKLQAISYEMIIKGLYHYTFLENNKWIEPVRRFLSSAFKTSQNAHTAFEWATYLSRTDKKNQALPLFDTAYTLAEALEEEYRFLYQAKCLWAKSEIEALKHNYAQAIPYASQALHLYTELAEQNAAEYRPRKVELLTTLGDYQMSANNPAVALIVFEEAVKIRRPLVLLDNYDSAVNLATLLDKQAAAHTAVGEYQAAFELYEESLRIKASDAFAKYESILEMKAATLCGMTDTYIAVKDYDAALRCANEALDIYRNGNDIDLSAPVPIPGTVKVLGKLSEINAFLGHLDDAIEQKQWVLSFLTSLAPGMIENEVLMSSVAENMYSLATLYYKSELYEDYLSLVGDTLKVFGHLNVVFPKEKKYLLKIGVLYRDVALYHQKITHNLKPMMFAVARTCEILAKEERDPEAERAYQDALWIQREYPSIPQDKKKGSRSR
jgi:tetratricopeptide (TPR) repeat protein